jgi:SAM-dependent methyltransferase
VPAARTERLSTLERHRQDWEELADVDPLWAILAAPEARGGRWKLNEFFASGEDEIAHVLELAHGLGYPKQLEVALDFGCGVGRLTRALGGHFREAVGVDISGEMIRLARELNEGRNCRFELNVTPDLAVFETNSLDFVYSALVLQHLPRKELIRSYLGEFLRVLRPGGVAVFQTISYLPAVYRLQPRRRAYAALRRIGLSHEILLTRLKLQPMRLTGISDHAVRSTVEAHGGDVEHVEQYSKTRDPMRSLRYYVHV